MMKVLERLWVACTQFLHLATLSPFNTDIAQQKPLLSSSPETTLGDYGPGPIFKPPGGAKRGYGSDFVCTYPTMVDWWPCSSPEDRGCWLTNAAGERFDINTNYEVKRPQGIQRNYTLVVSNGSINADGMLFEEAKLFNGTYPGPWLQACWGDTVEITVYNQLPWNGTSIHWHGIRQNQTMHMDGVNGITQCPIAPGDKFVYRWNATQYGSTWYHSHYSVQYSDGMQGPLTLHGPSSYPYDEAAKTPLIMTDWGHNSAFEAVYTSLQNYSILLNGIGNLTRLSGTGVAPLPVPEPYTLTFENKTKPRAKRYLLRLINTSFDTTFVFSIDNHNLTIIGADFVPIHNYTNTSVLIGIGQRYNVVVEAKPIANGSQPIPSDMNFWMRTYVSDCVRGRTSSFPMGYERSGILRYNSTSVDEPSSQPWNNVSMACSDETYSSLRPFVEWNIGSPANGHSGEERQVIGMFGDYPGKPFPLAAFALGDPATPGFIPLRINYSDPIFLNLNNTGGWPSQLVVTPENYKSNDWVYLVITGNRTTRNTFGAHPIHFHGHDFAILQQTANQTYDITKLDLKLDNPPRRDVVLLPANGFVVIAFKTDNPGSWLLHCHIAEHAAFGLALQVLERRADADAIWPFETSPAIAEARRVCGKWSAWYGDCKNYWPGGDEGCKRAGSDMFAFQDDSGI